ncbi:hypothetical protein FH972_023355 [Carpinus fangiana]|uniref:Uncharacterized protein n=1 Tax=Carpinus fangiana TaxID=176857 RepID=A0A5N6KVA7_9ROSI|nr:hypothetical protein FH972_023355 [Carpinus fangiana]
MGGGHERESEVTVWMCSKPWLRRHSEGNRRRERRDRWGRRRSTCLPEKWTLAAAPGAPIKAVGRALRAAVVGDAYYLGRMSSDASGATKSPRARVMEGSVIADVPRILP